EWRNELDGPFPVLDTIAPQATDADGVPVQCLPGLSGGEPSRDAARLTGHTVVHLHGGLTPASYDGWAENLFAPGQPAVFHYPNDQRAALLWYHDHVMGITKLDVYAGLAGLWIVRDDREREHGLLRTPVPVPADGLVLASAERADLLIDFSDLQSGSELTVLNTAAAPFDGSPFPAADAESAADLDGLLPYPQVLRFRVAGDP